MSETRQKPCAPMAVDCSFLQFAVQPAEGWQPWNCLAHVTVYAPPHRPPTHAFPGCIEIHTVRLTRSIDSVPATRNNK